MKNKKVLIIFLSIFIVSILTSAIAVALILTSKNEKKSENYSNVSEKTKELLEKCNSRIEAINRLDYAPVLKSIENNPELTLSDSKYLLINNIDDTLSLNSEYFLSDLSERDLTKVSKSNEKLKITQVNKEKISVDNFSNLVTDLIKSGVLKTFIHTNSESCITDVKKTGNSIEITLKFVHYYYTNKSNQEEYDVRFKLEDDGTIYAYSIN